ncbi:MAG: glycosyltransferase [Thermoleophilia bacterium]|nr:glycosyltransferase [Thermoleophilia bacterium]
MTSNSERPTASRFRSGSIGAAATPAQRLERLLDDGERMYALYEELVNDAIRNQRMEEFDGLVAVAERSEDPQRVYQARKYAAGALRAMSGAIPHDDRFLWAAPHDRTVALLVPALEAQPQEPELLNLLGASVYELGHTKLARRLFEAVRDIDPTHVQARANLRSVKDRLQRAQQVAGVPERLTPSFASLRTRIKRIAELAVRTEPRTVSVVMIVKDEEEMLPGCLTPLQGHVDQIVIVDTGSSDRTREIALEFGAEVHDFTWTGSFSEARNHALSFATGDWAVWLDADEHVIAEDAHQFRTLAQRTWVEGFHIIETHFMGSGDVGSEATHAPMRMFQRRPQYFWKGEVHEQLLGNFPTWLPERFQQTSIRVDHFGYLSTVVDARDKHERNLDLLMSQVQHERTAFTCFNIGTEHASMNDWAEALRWFEEAIAIAKDTDSAWHEQQFAPLMVQRTINARRSLGRTAAAIELAEQALGWWPAYTDLVYELAVTHAHSGDWIQTEVQARRALELGDAPARFVSAKGKGTYQARALLAAALREQNRMEECCAELERAQEEAPTFLGMLIDLTDALLETRGVDAASARVDELLGDRSHGATANVLIAAAFHDAGEYAAAEERYARVLTPNPTHSGALIARAELRLAQRDFEAAYTDAMTIDPLDIVASRAAQAAFLAAVVQEDADRMASSLERIATAQELPAAERAVYVAWKELATGASDGVTALVPTEPAAGMTVLRNLEALAKLEATDQFEVLHPLLAQVQPDDRLRHLQLAELYLRRQFVDMAGEEYMEYVQRFGPDPVSLTGLGKVATMKEMWEDAEILLGESLGLDPEQPDASRLLTAIQTRQVV